MIGYFYVMLCVSAFLWGGGLYFILFKKRIVRRWAKKYNGSAEEINKSKKGLRIVRLYMFLILPFLIIIFETIDILFRLDEYQFLILLLVKTTQFIMIDIGGIFFCASVYFLVKESLLVFEDKLRKSHAPNM